MKTPFTLLLMLCAALAFAAEYNFIALGDIHFDGKDYHLTIPKQEYRKKERARNFAIWNSGKAEKVLHAAGSAAGEKTAFVVQAGDFTQGDCDNISLQEQMFKDAFAVVKKHFPNHKLLPVKGNHDVRVNGIRGNCGEPADNTLFPLIAKELGRKSIDSNYTVRQGKDLFMFFDGFSGAKKAEAFVRKALEDAPDARYVFFITHLPVLPCSIGMAGWLIPAKDKIIPLLASRNAIVITAHTHWPSFISATTPDGTINQVVISSMGSQWDPDTKPYVKIDKLEVYLKEARSRKNVPKSNINALNMIERFTVNDFQMFSGHSGFAVIKVKDSGITAELYTGNSGKPWLIKNLCKNAKMENKK